MRKNKILLLKILFILCCFQNLTVISFESFGVKFYHIAAIVSLIYLLKKGKILLPDKRVLIFGLFILTISVLVSFKFGISSFVLNYFFAFYFLILLYNLGININEEEWIILFSRCAVFLMCLICVKNVVYIQVFIDFFKAPYGHPDAVPTFFGGGVNLEATYMAMFTPLFFKQDFKHRIIYSVASTLLSLIYVSRTALIVNFICWLWIGLLEMKSKNMIRVIELTVICVVAALILIERGSVSYMLERIAGLGNLSEEAGAQGRLRMWKFVWKAILDNPFGAGIGNSIPAIESVSHLSYGEDNIHNIYMQMFVDVGFIGGTYYLVLILNFIKARLKNIYFYPMASILMLYVVSSFLQFRGAEIFIYFFLASFLVIEANKKKLKGQILNPRSMEE